MNTPASIDTTNLLTILGFIAAVWAIITPTGKLRFRYCTSWMDWCVAIFIFSLANYLVFAPALMNLDAYFSLGPWCCGLDSSSAVYLLLLFTIIYFYFRTRKPTLVRSKLAIFSKLIEMLLLTKRYDEMVLLLEPQLSTLVALSKQQSLLVRLIDRYDQPKINLAEILTGLTPIERTKWRKVKSQILQRFKTWYVARDKTTVCARETLLNVATSSELIAHLAAANPYFCIKLLESDVVVNSDFTEEFMEALLASSNSRLYIELKNNLNLNGGRRLYIPESNRLLHFFFSNANSKAKYGLDKAIGEAVLIRLDEDKNLIGKLNEPLRSYADIGKFKCPINSGVSLFEIMVHEGIHQGLQDHMWLHYFHHFSEKILKIMVVSASTEEHLEWPTPLHYILYRLVSISLDWCEQCGLINDAEIPTENLAAQGFNRHYISKEAAQSLGIIFQDIISSYKLSNGFKRYLLEILIRTNIRLNCTQVLGDVNSELVRSVIWGSVFPSKITYRQTLSILYQQLDHRLRHDAAHFGEEIERAISET